MYLPNEGVELLFKHQNSILNIFHFDFNDQNHFMSLSDDGEIIEWIFNPEALNITEIVKFHLKRPDNDILSQKKHKIRPLKRGEYYKITQVIQFEEYLALGYSDGVILVYQITKKNKNKNNIKEKKAKMQKEKENKEAKEYEENNEKKEKPSMNEEDKVESESSINFNNNMEDEEEEREEKSYNIEKKDNSNLNDNNGLEYYNYFSLYYVLLGHLQEILSLCYIPQTKMIVSSSDDHTVKIFDFNNGHLIYYFKLDFIINRILYQNISRNKNDNKIIITLLSNDPVKVIINLSTNPITFNNYYFEHNDIIQLEKINDKFYALNIKNVAVLDKNLEKEVIFISLDNNIFFQYFNKFKNDYLIVDNENNVRIVELIQKNKDKENEAKDKNKKNEKNKKQNNAKNNNEDQEEQIKKINEYPIVTECKFKVGEDCIKGFYYYLDKYIFVYCQDGKVYLINYDKIKENYERMQMALEDAASLQMMSTLVIVKKPKKKAKTKKGKDKKK